MVRDRIKGLFTQNTEKWAEVEGIDLNSRLQGRKRKQMCFRNGKMENQAHCIWLKQWYILYSWERGLNTHNDCIGLHLALSCCCSWGSHMTRTVSKTSTDHQNGSILPPQNGSPGLPIQLQSLKWKTCFIR